jgi:hypothetical protein
MTSVHFYDSAVRATIHHNSLSSCGMIAHFSKIPLKEVEASVARLKSKRQIYVSARGLPLRYSIIDDLYRTISIDEALEIEELRAKVTW